MFSSGEWRSNSIDLLVKGLPIPERVLYPRYLDAMRRGKQRLIAIFGRAEELLNRFDENKLSSVDARYEEAARCGLDGPNLRDLRICAGNMTALQMMGESAKQPFFFPGGDYRLDKMPLDAIVLANLECLSTERSRFGEIVERLHNL